MGSVITNFYLPDKELAVTVEISVDYRSDLRQVEKVTVETAKEVLKKTAGGVPEFEARLRSQKRPCGN